jgi:hypothetical protein
LRYYILPAANTINVFAEAAYGWTGFYHRNSDAIIHQWSVSVGTAFFLNRNMALEAALNYTNITEVRLGYPKTLGLNIGFQVYLGK